MARRETNGLDTLLLAAGLQTTAPDTSSSDTVADNDVVTDDNIVTDNDIVTDNGLVTAPAEQPFWETKTLDEMSTPEWESLCDGCARCCLNKLEDWDTGEIHWTHIACRLLDDGTCRCRDYENRTDTVPDCIPLDPEAIRELTWLPPTCGYRLVGEGKPLYWWHPLVSGDPETVHHAGISVRGRTISEDGIALEDYEHHLAAWPGEE